MKKRKQFASGFGQACYILRVKSAPRETGQERTVRISPFPLFLPLPIRYHRRIALSDSQGCVIRHLPPAEAARLVALGSAAPKSTTGRVREIYLLRTAATSAARLGPATGRLNRVKFTHTVRLEDSGRLILEHDPSWLLLPGSW